MYSKKYFNFDQFVYSQTVTALRCRHDKCITESLYILKRGIQRLSTQNHTILNVPCIKRNAIPNNNQLITYYLPVCYLLRIQQYPVNTTYNKYLIFEQNGLTYRQQWYFSFCRVLQKLEFRLLFHSDMFQSLADLSLLSPIDLVLCFPPKINKDYFFN